MSLTVGVPVTFLTKVLLVLVPQNQSFCFAALFKWKKNAPEHKYTKRNCECSFIFFIN